MELKSDLSGVKPGDWVLTLQYGWVKVIDILEGGKFQVLVNGAEGYTWEGKYMPYDKYPTCFPADQVPKCFLEIYGPPVEKFEDGEPVWVSNNRIKWTGRVFKEYGLPSNPFIVHGMEGERLSWKYCRKWEDKPDEK